MGLRLIVTFFSLAMLTAGAGRAQTSTWSGATGGDFLGIGNWDLLPTGITGNLVFGNSANTNLNIDAVPLLPLDGIFTANNVTFTTTTGYAFNGSGNPIFQLLGGITTQAANTVTFSQAVQIRLSNTSHTVNLASGSVVTIDSVVSGSDGVLVKTGAGTLSLRGLNTYTGGTTINQGSLQLGSNGAISHATANTLIGASGLASMVVNGGADLTNQTLRIGVTTSTASMSVEGSGSTVTSNVYTYVGELGSGTLSISNGGSVTTANMSIGNNSTSPGVGLGVGVVTVSGPNSTLTQTATGSNPGIFVGSEGNGTLYVEDGAKVNSFRGVIGNNAGGIGATYISDAGSAWTTTQLTIGGATSGLLLVADGGKVSVTGGSVVLGGSTGGIGNLSIGDASAGGIVDVSAITTGSGAGTVSFNTTAAGNSPYYLTRDGTNGGTPVVLTGATKVQQLGGYTILSGNSTYTGTTTITGGTLVADHSSALGTGAVNVNGGTLLVTNNGSVNNSLTLTSGRLGGLGFVQTAAIGNGFTLAPGMPGQLGEMYFDHLELASGGVMEWHLQDPSPVEGLGWDTLFVQSPATLDITATAANKFTLKLISLNAAGTPGTATGFNSGQSYSWLLFDTDGISGFDPVKFSLDETQFMTDAGLGTLSLSLNGSNLFLNFTPVPEPSTYALLAAGLTLVALRVRRRRQKPLL